jgi:lipoprotein
MQKLLFSAAFLLLLSACGSAADEAHDVQWYLEHEAQMVKCKNDPAKLQDTPACINAMEAARQKVRKTNRLDQPYERRH